MMLLHCLWGKSNNTTCGQFECDVLGIAFALISFVHMHGADVVPEFVYVFKSRKKSGKVKHELRVQVHERRVRIHELRVQIHELRVRIHEL